MARLQIRLGANLSPLRAALRSAGSLLRSFAKGAAAVGGGMAAFAGIRGAARLLRGTLTGLKGAFDLGSEMDDTSARTGVMVGELVTMTEAFRQAGVDAGKVQSSLLLMQRNVMGITGPTTNASAALDEMGVSISDLRGMTTGDQFKRIAEGISSIEDPAKRADAAMRIFGRSGGELLTLFRDPEAFNKAAQTLGTQAELLQKNAGIFDRISDLLGGVGIKMRGFFIGIGERIAPVLLDVLESIDKIDFAKWGQQIGDAVMVLFDAFMDGSIFELIRLGLGAAFEWGINHLKTIAVTLFDFLGNLLADPLMNAVDAALDTVFGRKNMSDEEAFRRNARIARQNQRRAEQDDPDTSQQEAFTESFGELLERMQSVNQERIDQLQAQFAPKPVSAPIAEDEDGEDAAPARSMISSIVSSLRRIGGESGTTRTETALLSIQQRSEKHLDKISNGISQFISRPIPQQQLA